MMHARAAAHSITSSVRPKTPAISLNGRLWNIRAFAASVRLDACEPHHLAPLLGFVGDQLAEVSGRTRKHRAAEVSKPRFHVEIGEAGVDLLVELVDDLGRCGLRC